MTVNKQVHCVSITTFKIEDLPGTMKSSFIPLFSQSAVSNH